MITLSAREHEVLTLLVEGHSLRTVSRRLGISDATVNAHRRELMRTFRVSTTAELVSQAVQAAGVSEDNGRKRETVRLQHQTRWLPEFSLSHTRPLGHSWRQAFNCHSLRDVADVLREFGHQPGPCPDDPDAVLRDGSGTLGAKHALLAALAAECGRDDVRLVVACHELEFPVPTAPGERRLTLPLAVCYLHCRARDVQIADDETGSILHAKAVTTVRVEPRALAQERVRLYQAFASDWCRALDMAPVAFAKLRAEQLLIATRQSVIEDLLGHGLPPSYAPGAL